MFPHTLSIFKTSSIAYLSPEGQKCDTPHDRENPSTSCYFSKNSKKPRYSVGVIILPIYEKIFLHNKKNMMKCRHFSSDQLKKPRFWKRRSQGKIKRTKDLLKNANKEYSKVNGFHVFRIPDPNLIRIQSGQWIRIQEGKNDQQK